MESMAVQLGGASHCTLASGAKVPRTSIIATSNQHFAESDRFASAHVTYTHNIHAYTCRNGVRMIHIPFGEVNVDTRQDRRGGIKTSM